MDVGKNLRTNRRSNRINKKKAVPLYFQKSHSNSQFLAAANYKHQIKKLKKVNKELACSLQDVKCRAADQERALAECNRENTQMMFVKMKIKDIVETVKKLVTDLGEVYDVIDGKTFDFIRNCSASHQEARLKIRNPSISTIEESASMSSIEPNLDKEEESLCVENSTVSANPPSFFDADSSRTEIYNVPLVLALEPKLQDVSNGRQSADARSSKSMERTGSLPLDLDSTPQPPVLPPHYQLSIKSLSFMDACKLRPITSQASVESQKSTDLKFQFMASPSATKSTAKSIISKIPVKKPAASTEQDTSGSVVSSSHMNRRKTFVVDGKIKEPQLSPTVSDQRGTIVLNSLADNASLNIIPNDRRGTFVLNSLADNAKLDIISDKSEAYVMSSLTGDTMPNAVFDRRATYFIPTQSETQPDTSPPKVVKALIPDQNPAPNQTILLCEDMELTEIIPHQNQSHQFIPIIPSWSEKLENKESGLNEKLSASVRDQPSCNTFIKKLPVSNINSSKQFEVSATSEVVKDVQIRNTVDIKKNGGNKSLASNILTKSKLMAEVLASSQDKNSTDPQQKINKERGATKNLKKEDTNIKPVKELPSPITNYGNPNMSIQNKILESFSAINTVSDKNKPSFDSTCIAEGNDIKKSTTSKDSLSTKPPVVEKVTVVEDAESDKTERRSIRKQNKCFDKFFTDSDESDIAFDEDFIPNKRFSLKPGRKIIDPNNKKVFVFKNNSKKQSTDKDSLTDTNTNKSNNEVIKNEQEKDIFNFSNSSDADKSPLIKSKKRKSVMPKSNKQSVKKQSDVGRKLSKRTSKRSFKPEENKDEVPVAAPPRKSILCLNKDINPLPLKQSNRKSVRFTVSGSATQDEINDSKCDSSNRENAILINQEFDDIRSTEKAPSDNTQDKSKRKSIEFILVGATHQDEINLKCHSPCEKNYSPVNQESDDIHDTEKVSTYTTRGSQGKKLSAKKKYSLAGSNSLKATGEIVKSNTAKPKRSRKRRSSNVNSDSHENVCESECSPKKMLQAVNETPPKKNKTHTNSRLQHSQSTPCAVPPEVSEEKPAGSKKEKKSGLSDANVEVTGSANEVEKTDFNKAKRLSEDISNKNLSIVGDYSPFEAFEQKPVDRNKERNSSEIFLDLLQTRDVKVIGSMDDIEDKKVNQAKRTFSGVSERRSNKKQSIVDDLFPSLDDVVCERVDKKMETSFTLVEDKHIVKEMVKTDCNKKKSVTLKTPKQRSEKKPSSKKQKVSSRQSKDKENVINNVEKNLKLDVLTSDNNLCTLFESKECIEKILKPKNSRKKKESSSLLQEDLKADVLCSENEIGNNEAVSGRSRRNRATICFKEPKLNSKMRRE